jgi:SAM-dependent methyltransferase
MLSRRAFAATLAAHAARGQGSQQRMFSNAEAYQRFMGRWSNVLAPLLVNFASVPDRGTVLDVGSGTGALAFSIAKLRDRCEVVGIDPSKEYIEYADSRNPFPGRARFQIGDAQQLRFPDAAFDASVSLLVFNFIPDRNKALREVCRVTKPGGYVSAAVWDYAGGMRMLRMFWDAAIAIDPAAEKFDESKMPLCRHGELGKFWKEAGLQNVAEEPLGIVTQFVSFADFWQPFLLGQGPAGAYVRSLDPIRQSALRTELKRRLNLKSEDAPFPLPARAWAVRGAVRN